MNFAEWMQSVPSEIKDDTLWRMQLYQQALFLGEIAWFDASKLLMDQRTVRISDQLYRAVGKISSNIAEGYSKASGKDQARFYEYGLGSAREARDWYYKGRHVLHEAVARHRMQLLVHIIRQLLTLIPMHRAAKLAEEPAYYDVYPLDTLLMQVPLPDIESNT
ncbi:MAG: four helix bundle protein [Ardenticatenaceae bacterium]|nr:four helix bundle protein [Ardenticatenaceae bacterium]